MSEAPRVSVSASLFRRRWEEASRTACTRAPLLPDAPRRVRARLGPTFCRLTTSWPPLESSGAARFSADILAIIFGLFAEELASLYRFPFVLWPACSLATILKKHGPGRGIGRLHTDLGCMPRSELGFLIPRCPSQFGDKSEVRSVPLNGGATIPLQAPKRDPYELPAASHLSQVGTIPPTAFRPSPLQGPAPKTVHSSPLSA